ncbi:GvpL/GvpF family gas vesicle protein [Lentibacillus sediminis]|uniref:GvpL/GvpF family gas vesicle protein n=1 Tax=Lentibacillus sediminis TaxID=1940529 RepID=UPI000C1C0E25|nr:GvpL/GvpF family gas vesicle protein [Lentibacillus sediminis]
MNKLIYLYGIIPGGSSVQPFKGLDEQSDVYTIPFEDVDAVVCNLDETEYGEKELEKKTNDAKWLHEKAFHHHEALMSLYKDYPVIPMKFCTIYKSTDNLQETIDTHRERMVELLDVIADKEEWILKIYCEEDKVRDTVSEKNETVEAKKQEIAALSPGRQYLEKRKLDQTIDQESDREKQRFADWVHEELRGKAIDNEVKRNWNKDITGRSEEMCFNGVYMLEKPAVDEFLNQVSEIQNQSEDGGWLLEVTGPWPSYHFAQIS